MASLIGVGSIRASLSAGRDRGGTALSPRACAVLATSGPSGGPGSPESRSGAAPRQQPRSLTLSLGGDACRSKMDGSVGSEHATGMLSDGRASFEQRAWADAFERLRAADRHTRLAAADLERLASAAHLLGEDGVSAVSWERAHHEHAHAGEIARAVRCAFWLAFGLLNRGEAAQGGGWLARAQRLLDAHELDCVERGYLRVPQALRALEDHGHTSDARRIFGEIVEFGDRFGDPDLVAMGRLGQGQASIRAGDTSRGLVLLDEVMVAVIAEETSATVTGLVYCAAILACREAFDLQRAHEWTRALSDWCDSQPELALFRGQCLVHRAEIMQLHGRWTQAMVEAERARERLSEPSGQPAIGMAHYQLGELLRLRGRFDEAEHAYQKASASGRDPHPGLAQLRLAQGEADLAEAAIRRVLDESRHPLTRASVLPSYVEITLATGDVAGARAAADELAAIVTDLDAPLLHAMALDSAGAVLLAEGEAGAALEALRGACDRWRELDAPYEHARARVRFASACRELGDEDSAVLELEAARDVLAQLGATPDLTRVEELLGRRHAARDQLTSRQIEVLALVAEGRTNRRIAEELVISEHTVRRHLQNVFTRLGVSSRAAATAYAVEHGLIRAPDVARTDHAQR